MDNKIKEKGVKRMKKLLVVIILLILIPFCVVVWAGLDAAGGSLINCRAIITDTTYLNLVVSGGGLLLEYDEDHTDNSLATLTGDFAITGAIVNGVTDDLDVSVDIVPTSDNLYNLGSSSKRWKNLWVSQNMHYGTSSANYRIDLKAGGVVGSDTFTGSGLDDLTAAGTFNGTVADDISYKVEIDGTGTPDTFKWSDDGGSTWDVEDVNITGSAQTLNNGVTVTFAATTGHTTGDYWTWTVTVHNPMWLQDAAGDGVLKVKNDGQVIFTGDSAAAADTVSAWEIDGSDDLMPVAGMFNDPDWDLDSNGDLMPAQIIYFEVDTSGNLMPNL